VAAVADPGQMSTAIRSPSLRTRSTCCSTDSASCWPPSSPSRYPRAPRTGIASRAALPCWRPRWACRRRSASTRRPTNAGDCAPSGWPAPGARRWAAAGRRRGTGPAAAGRAPTGRTPIVAAPHPCPVVACTGLANPSLIIAVLPAGGPGVHRFLPGVPSTGGRWVPGRACASRSTPPTSGDDTRGSCSTPDRTTRRRRLCDRPAANPSGA